MAVSTDTTRRGLVGGLAAIAALLSGAGALARMNDAPAAVPTDEEIAGMVKQLTAALKARDGGNWSWMICNRTSVIAINRFGDQ